MAEKELETRIFNHEGTTLLATEDEAPQHAICALVIYALPGQGPGDMDLRWRCHGYPIHAVPTMAKFLLEHPPFAMAVQGLMAVMATGRLDGRQACGHDHSADQ